jgi:hypothetical protein
MEVQPSECRDGTKVYSKLVHVSSSTSVGSGKARGNSNNNHNQGILSGDVVQMCSSDSQGLGKLTSICPSQLEQQLNVNSINSQHTFHNNLLSDGSNIYVNVSQDMPQFIQLCNQNTNLVIQPMVHDITQLVQNDNTEKQCADLSEPSPKEKLCHLGHTLKPNTKANVSTLCTTNVIRENYVQKNVDVPIANAGKTNLDRSQDSSRGMEVEKPKTYANLRTFLESSEVVETLSGGRHDDIGDGNGLVNVEYVTLMADIGNESSLTSGMQEIIVLPHETRISDYDLSKNAGKFRIVVEGSDNSSKKKNAYCKDQIRKGKTESVTVLTQALVPSQNRNSSTHLSTTVEKGRTSGHVLQTSGTKCDNVVEVFLSNTEGIKLSTDAGSVNGNNKNETLHSSQVMQVLLETDGNSVGAHQGNVDKPQQSFLVSSDNFSDEDAIIRMLNSQGTVMLTTQTDFSMTESPVAEVRCMTEGTTETVGMVVSEDQKRSALNFRSFSSVDDTVVCEIPVKKQNNGNIDLSAPDCGHEIPLTVAVTLDNSDANSVLRKNVPEEEELKKRGLETGEQNDAPAGSVDDIQMYELCTEEDLTKLSPIYQIYQNGKSVENI